MMKTRKIALLGILIAMNVAISLIRIPISPVLQIQFTFILTMLVAANFSMKDCIIHAVIEDILSFIIFPDGQFFLGYTLSAVVGIAIYNLFLNKRVTLLRIFISKALVNLLVNVGLGSLWAKILYSSAFIVRATAALTKNLILLPIEVIIFFAVYKIVQPLFDKFNKVLIKQ